MTTGTKIALAVIVLMVGLLAVYYGGTAIFGGGSPIDQAATNTTSAESLSAPGDSRAALADSSNASTAQPIDPLLLGPVDPGANSIAMGALGTDMPRDRSTLGPVSPGNGSTQSPSRGPEIVLPSSGQSPTHLVPNQPASLGGDTISRPPLAGQPTYLEYTVESGDTLSSIAMNWFGDGTKWDLIARANPYVDPNRLKIGQKLRLPPKEDGRSAPSAPPPVPPPGSTQYIVQTGDTLVSIARAYYSDPGLWEVLFDANKSAIGGNPDRLKVGMRLIIPPAPRPAR